MRNRCLSFIFQFLFERVESISRATIIDLDAHQVSPVCVCWQCLGADTDSKVRMGLMVIFPKIGNFRVLHFTELNEMMKYRFITISH